MPKQANLRNFLNLVDADCFALSETFLVDGLNFSVPRFNIVRADRDSRAGGVLLGVKDNYSYNRVQLVNLGSIEAVACSIDVYGQLITVASIYIPPSCLLNSSALRSMINQLPQPIFLLGDFNAHGCAWGESYDDSRANLIYDLLDDFDLSVLNTGEVTRLAYPLTRSSRVDLSICSSSFALNCSWAVLDDSAGSDHMPIHVELSKWGSFETTAQYDLTKNIDWEKYSTIISRATIGCETDIADLHDFITNLMVESAHRAQTKPIPVSTTVQKTTTVWWDRECSEIVKKRSKALKEFKKYGAIHQYLEYKRLEASSKKLFKSKKRSYWKNFVDTFVDRDSNDYAVEYSTQNA